jgi:hypothetical protein
MRRYLNLLDRAQNEAKERAESMLAPEPTGPHNLIGLARCCWCRAILLMHRSGHSNNPRWGETCSPLRDERCDVSFKLFFRDCHNEGAENW